MRLSKFQICSLRRPTRARMQYLLMVGFIGVYLSLGNKACNYLYRDEGPGLTDVVLKYGYVITMGLYFLLCTAPYLSVTSSVLNIVGLLVYNPFRKQVKRRNLSSDTPFICFRVVTRGLFPKLVADVTDANLETCRNVGLRNFKFEIVTDNSLDIKASNCVREIVVPKDYKTPNMTLFKARALHYCLSTNINILSTDDWIVHLDEETLLTDDVLHGIVDFVSKPTSNIGQGVITYGGCGVENWITTLLDGIRVFIDYGIFRLGLQIFRRPVFGFKGSFVVVKMGIEQQVGFDFGPRECIAEDLRFALGAWTQGYKFDFIHGVMKEKSPFTLADYIKQRKRWFIGHFHIVWSNSLPLYCKLFILPMNIVNMLLWTNIVSIVLTQLCGVVIPLQKWQLLMFCFLTANILFMLAFGNLMSLCRKRYSLPLRLLLCFVSQLLVPVLTVVECWAALQGLKDRNKLAFDIVNKETVSQKTLKSESSQPTIV